MGVVSGATQCVLKVENIYTELRDDYQKAPEEIDEVLPMTHSVAALILQ